MQDGKPDKLVCLRPGSISIVRRVMKAPGVQIIDAGMTALTLRYCAEV